MNSKQKFKIADRNKPGIDRAVTKLLTVLNCDKDALLAEVAKYQDEKNDLIRAQNYGDAAELRDKERAALSLLETMNSIDTLNEIYEIFEDCVFFEYAPKDVIELCNKMIDSRPTKMPKDMTSFERKHIRVAGLAKTIVEYTPYKFFFMGGAMAEHRTLFAKDHKEAWNKANEYCVESFGGNILGIFCLTKDGEDVGTLRNLAAMFEPITEGPNEVRSVRAIDLIPNYQDHK